MVGAAFVFMFCSFLSATNADVVVYSGVPCGIIAAVAASRDGAKVILVEPTKHIGGRAIECRPIGLIIALVSKKERPRSRGRRFAACNQGGRTSVRCFRW